MNVTPWLYKVNINGGPAGFWGDWETMVFNKKRAIGWGGHYSSLSPEVWNYLDYDVRLGDLVVAYQTDKKKVIGLCAVVGLPGTFGNRELKLYPMVKLPDPLPIHEVKKGTILEASSAVKSMVMMRPMTPAEFKVLVRLCCRQTEFKVLVRLCCRQSLANHRQLKKINQP